MSLEFIIFDLDNTLYTRGSGLMEEIGRRIQVWLCRELHLTWEEAKILRRKYLREYGTTMGGLVAEHSIDVRHYLEFVHDIPVEDYLEPDPALVEMLGEIPLRKVVYTNATSAHGRRVLYALGAYQQFEQIIGIEEVGLDNKVDPSAYESMLALLGAAGSECVMVEDSPRNLLAAKAVGMTTILVRSEQEPEQGKRDARSVDFAVDSILDVEKVVDQLLAPAKGTSSELG
ncbi:MAG: pyrimidine 5'-nucleotidase [Anaerolineae bacterium]|jgi:putative hydrolase of the HAD superfamily